MPVLLRDSNALESGSSEIGQKTGMLPITHQNRSVLGLALPVLVLPWPVAALTGVVLPLVRNRRVRLPWRPGAVLVPLVLGGRQPGDVQRLGGGQTELLYTRACREWPCWWAWPGFA